MQPAPVADDLRILRICTQMQHLEEIVSAADRRSPVFVDTGDPPRRGHSQCHLLRMGSMIGRHHAEGGIAQGMVSLA